MELLQNELEIIYQLITKEKELLANAAKGIQTEKLMMDYRMINHLKTKFEIEGKIK